MKMKKDSIETPYLDETMPHQINSPSFKGSSMTMQPPFVNEHGVVIGDSLYNSEDSPLNNWSDDVDPAVMAGEQWVHPTNDIGWNSAENRDLVEKSKKPQGVPFTHPDKDVSYGRD